MDTTSLLAILGGLVAIIALIASTASQVGGGSMEKKFRTLGNMKGMSLAQITAQVGPPNSFTAMPNGHKLYQWIKAGVHIALMFDENDMCLSIKQHTSI